MSLQILQVNHQQPPYPEFAIFAIFANSNFVFVSESSHGTITMSATKTDSMKNYQIYEYCWMVIHISILNPTKALGAPWAHTYEILGITLNSFGLSLSKFSSFPKICLG